MNKQLLWFAIMMVLTVPVFSQKPDNKQPSKAIINTSPVNNTQLKEALTQPAAPDYYRLEFTALIVEARQKFRLATQRAFVNILFTDGFYITIPIDNNSGGKLYGVGRCSRKLADTSIARIELIYANQPNRGGNYEWEVFDVIIRGMAMSIADPGKTFMWETKNFFSNLQILLPGQVAESLTRRSMRLSDYTLRNSYVTSLCPQFIIGKDDIRDNYSAFNMLITLKSNPGVFLKSPVAPRPDYRQKLKGANTFFGLTNEEFSRGFPFGQEWRDNSNNRIQLGVRLADLDKVSMEYMFGDHGPLENDDWDLEGLCLNVIQQGNTGYRYYTNWKLKKRMARTSRLDIL
ncbi:MAG: hypothetical protein J7621_02135 [Niastella sp.]|nr:hypothetical protein [Niastella sp.]